MTILNVNMFKSSHARKDRYYRDALEIIEPERDLYLAVRHPVYASFFQRRFIAAAVERYQLRLITYDPKQEVIVKWL